MFPNTTALQGILAGDKVRTSDGCPKDAALWCRLEYRQAVRHG